MITGQSETVHAFPQIIFLFRQIYRNSKSYLLIVNHFKKSNYG